MAEQKINPLNKKFIKSKLSDAMVQSVSDVSEADIDISDGDRFVFLKRILPDILFVNDTGTSQNPAINVVVKRRDFNNQTLSTDSTTQITASSTFGSLRSRARQFVLRFESDDDNTDSDKKNYKWRLGSTRVDIQPSGRR